MQEILILISVLCSSHLKSFTELYRHPTATPTPQSLSEITAPSRSLLLKDEQRSQIVHICIYKR